jgi:predicted ArsR family transcriptional regulator
MAKLHCLYDILIPYYQILLQKGTGDQPWTCVSIAKELGLKMTTVRSRCLNRLRAEGYIMNAQVSDLTLKPKIRANSAGYGKTHWIFTQKFKTLALNEGLSPVKVKT